MYLFMYEVCSSSVSFCSVVFFDTCLHKVLYLLQIRDLDYLNYVRRKHSILQVKNNDHMCMARCIMTWKAKLDGHLKYSSIRKGCKIQEEIAIDLHRQAGVRTDEPCGVEEAEKFQKCLPGYQIIIISIDNRDSIIYEGPPAGDQRIILYLGK